MDQGITAEHREQMTEALKSAPAVAAGSRIIVYPDAPHGFNADYRPSYVKADAEDGWAKMLAFFKAHGVA
jgi:carboxymethylenebutenolidase